MTPHGHKGSAGKFVSSVWSFPDREPATPYRWFGTLPRAITDRLLDLYAPKAGILDAFAGTGTALVSASSAGRPSIGYDVNPLAVLIARARLSGCQSQEDRTKWLSSLSKWMTSSRNRSRAHESLGRARSEGALDYTQRWFEPENLSGAWLLLQGLIATRAPAEAWPVFAATIRDIASVDARCTHHLVRKARPPLDAFQSFASRADSLDSAWFAAGSSSATMHHGSFEAHQEPVGLLLAHPPYEGVINYHAIHRLTTDLMSAANVAGRVDAAIGLNFEYEQLRNSDVSSDNRYRYAEFVDRFCEWAPTVVVPGGRISIIIGDSRHKGMLRHPFSQFLSGLESRGFALEEMFIWILQHNAGMHVLRRSNFIDHNYVMILRRS